MKKIKKPANEFNNCEFAGVKFDGQALDCLKDISEAILQNGKNVEDMLRIFKGQQIEMKGVIYLAANNEEPTCVLNKTEEN